MNIANLLEQLKKMGARPQHVVLPKEPFQRTDQIRLSSPRGIEVSLDDLEITQEGALSYKGSHVTLHIEDQWKIEEVLSNPLKGRRVHFWNCKTIKEMRENGRFERYVISHNTYETFHITGLDGCREPIEGYVKLKVCKNCLAESNYKNYHKYHKQKNEMLKNKIFNEFSFVEMFKKFSVYFPHQPKRKTGEQNTSDYPDNWKEISKQYREKKNWICEQCKVDLSEHPKYLHTHHISGVKTDNQLINLKALCLICHSQQPKHNHMIIYKKQRELIESLRLNQKKTTSHMLINLIK